MEFQIEQLKKQIADRDERLKNLKGEAREIETNRKNGWGESQPQARRSIGMRRKRGRRRRCRKCVQGARLVGGRRGSRRSTRKRRW